MTLQAQHKGGICHPVMKSASAEEMGSSFTHESCSPAKSKKTRCNDCSDCPLLRTIKSTQSYSKLRVRVMLRVTCTAQKSMRVPISLHCMTHRVDSQSILWLFMHASYTHSLFNLNTHFSYLGWCFKSFSCLGGAPFYRHLHSAFILLKSMYASAAL